MNSDSRNERAETSRADFSLFYLPYMQSGSVRCKSRTGVGKDRWMASRRVGYPVVVSQIKLVSRDYSRENIGHNVHV